MSFYNNNQRTNFSQSTFTFFFSFSNLIEKGDIKPKPRININAVNSSLLDKVAADNDKKIKKNGDKKPKNQWFTGEEEQDETRPQTTTTPQDSTFSCIILPNIL